MILEAHWSYHQEMKPYLADPLLMLGRQTTALDPKRDIQTGAQAFKHLGIDKYTTLDPDGGDINLDLNDDLTSISGAYGTVYNLGTLEHVWDVHTAYCNALRAVGIGGHFVNVAPVQGWDGHGIHVTDMQALMNMVKINGFDILHKAVSVQSRGVLLWCAAKKREHIMHLADFRKPQQHYTDGKKTMAA